ncbi:MAG: methyltransferase [Thermoplasmata archaeon]|nr:methyltransferase [Thermoplasmata archaeon]
MKKKSLEIILEGVEKYTRPKNILEQYFTPPGMAADILFFAHLNGDIKEKIVADFGAGTGIFTVGSCLLEAKKIYAVEIDREAIEILKENLKKFQCKQVEIIHSSVESFKKSVDTVIQNPPFGSQRKHADLPFLIQAMKVSKVVYSLHNAETKAFIEKKVEDMGWKITHVKRYSFPIPRTFFFHRKDVVETDVLLFRILKR